MSRYDFKQREAAAATPGPRTESGKALLADLAYTRDNYLDPILAIEAEAGGLAIREAQLASRIEAEAAIPDATGLRAALERLPRATCYRTHLQTDEHLGVSGAVWIADAIRAQARPAVASEGLRAVLLADLTALAHWSPEEWAERGRGGDPIARTINAARDIVEARLT